MEQGVVYTPAVSLIIHHAKTINFWKREKDFLHTVISIRKALDTEGKVAFWAIWQLRLYYLFSIARQWKKWLDSIPNAGICFSAPRSKGLPLINISIPKHLAHGVFCTAWHYLSSSWGLPIPALLLLLLPLALGWEVWLHTQEGYVKAVGRSCTMQSEKG